MFTETWLLPCILDSELFDSNVYTVFRCDRSRLNSRKNRGGGVLVAVIPCFKSELVIVPNSDHLEIVFVRVHVHSLIFYISCLYIAPDLPTSVLDDYSVAFDRFLSIASQSVNARIIVAGDFNLSDVCWVAESDSATFLPTNVSRAK